MSDSSFAPGVNMSPDRSFPGCESGAAVADPYQALLARLRRATVPYSVLWELTHACNLRCVMCYNVRQDPPELSTDECLEILGQLAQAGVLRLTLTGGEILTRPDFFIIAEQARNLGFALDLKTNGTLITPFMADRIAALPPVQVDISLLGARPETFDAVAGAQHTLERVLRGVSLLQERGVRVKLNSLLLDLNLPERTDMLDLAASLGVHYEQVFKVSPADDGRAGAGIHQISRQQMQETLATDRAPSTLKTRISGDRTCGVGLSSCLISPYGVVFPCIELRVRAGDLRRQRFAAIWRDAPVFRELRQRHTWDNLAECRSCSIQAYCEGRCAGIAWKEHGDLYRGHLVACRHAQARFTLANPDVEPPETPAQTRDRIQQQAGPAAQTASRSAR